MQERIEVEEESKAMLSSVKFKVCPIEVAIGTLGKKWTFLILWDMALLKINRFNLILRSLPGLTPRVFITRLHELEEHGLIGPVVISDRLQIVEWILTEKGRDTVPILMSIMSFGTKWCAEEVFEDPPGTYPGRDLPGYREGEKKNPE